MSVSSGSLSAINKIHINNSTKMTLSDRFTGFSEQPKIHPRTSPRFDVPETPVDRAASIANRRLLKQLAQKHTREAALKLKRRSMKPRLPPTAAYTRVANGVPLKRGSVKALRLGPNGRLMKANSITNVATMEADFLGPPSRRSNSVSRVSERVGGRLVAGMSGAGGGRSSRRIARPTWRGNNNQQLPPPPSLPRMRSRSRSRTRRTNPATLTIPRNSQSGIAQRLSRVERSNSRPRTRAGAINRSRSRSVRSRLTQTRNNNRAAMESVVPIKSRLGRRPSAAAPKRSRSVSRGGAGGRRPRRDGVVSGRIQKRRNSIKSITTAGAGNTIQNRISRTRGRYNTQQRSAQPANQRINTQFLKNRNISTRGRARSRSRPGGNRPLVNAQRNNDYVQQQNNRQNARGRGIAVRGTNRRGRSRQRGATRGMQRSNNGVNGQQQGQQQQQQRRGRSRSRRRGVSRGGRQLGKDKPEVKKEDLDKELDQYMSSTKTTDGL